MRKTATRILYLLTCLLLLPARPASADQALDNAIEQADKYTAFVFLVNGFTGCCVPGKKFQKFLREKGAYVHISNWNEIDRKGNPGVPAADPDDFAWKVTPSPPTDETFIKQMQEVIKRIDARNPSMPIVLIGHSYGGDAVLQVVKRINGRKIAFLGVLDGVGKGGLRKNITQPVPDNVEYFFNRWQQKPTVDPTDVAPVARGNRCGRNGRSRRTDEYRHQSRPPVAHPLPLSGPPWAFAGRRISSARPR